ncbi:hypothetical protein [Streptomyces sp. NPDC007369]|uniref:hypothetical protein n=1 Tax=Streptomyces sp. NPDC007369 TaxID=3154589 RepID=UPI0034012E75
MSDGRPGPAAGPEVVVGRLSATLRYDPGEVPPAADRLRGPLRHAVDDHLEAALHALALPPGRWCLSRLDLTLALDLDRPDAALARDWSRAVAEAVARTVREDRGAAVHYPSDADLLADAVTGLAAGRLERLWAWRQTGLVRPGDPAPAAAPGEAVLAVLERHPRQAAATVLRAAGRCGAAALDRALGRRGWQRLAALAAGGGAPPPPAGTEPGPATRTLARTLLAGSRFAALVRAARLRPAEPTAAAWAVLVLAETDPAALHRPGARPGLHRLLAEVLYAPGAVSVQADVAQRSSTTESEPGGAARPAAAGPAGNGPLPGFLPGHVAEAAAGAPPAPSAPIDAVGSGRCAPAPDTPAQRATARTPAPEARPAADPSRESAPAPAAGPSAEGVPTDWAGLPFLLATAAEAGLPDRVLDDPALAARPLPWVLYAAARALVPAVPAGDPATLALAGLDPSRAARALGAEPPTPAEQARIEALATAWARATAIRLAAAAPTPDTVERAPALSDPSPDAVAPAEGQTGGPLPLGGSGPVDPAVRPAPAGGVPSPVSGAGASEAADQAAWAAPSGTPGAPVPAPAPASASGDAEAVRVVARRRGRVVAEAGWVEVVLAAGSADPQVRRAGLDLDPGWVGWLGAVVRYRYV